MLDPRRLKFALLKAEVDELLADQSLKPDEELVSFGDNKNDNSDKQSNSPQKSSSKENDKLIEF